MTEKTEFTLVSLTKVQSFDSELKRTYLIESMDPK